MGAVGSEQLVLSGRIQAAAVTKRSYE